MITVGFFWTVAPIVVIGNPCSRPRSVRRSSPTAPSSCPATGGGADNAAMVIDSASCYRALSTRDVRFDGRFFVGVSSTRIYCRPVCRVRTPKAANCRFFQSAAAAEVAGYRPCLRCRPELAPRNASVDATARVAQAAAALIEDQTFEGGGPVDVASRLAITDRHLRRTVGAAFGGPPLQ